MTPAVLALIVSLHTCGQKPLTFPDFFFASYYYSAAPGQRITQAVAKLMVEAQAPYMVYFSGVSEKCK